MKLKQLKEPQRPFSEILSIRNNEQQFYCEMDDDTIISAFKSGLHKSYEVCNCCLPDEYKTCDSVRAFHYILLGDSWYGFDWDEVQKLVEASNEASN